MKFFCWILFGFVMTYIYGEERGPEDDNVPKNEPTYDHDIDPVMMLIRSAKHVKYDQKIVTAEGDLKCRYKGYDILADHATGNTETGEYILEGNALAISSDKYVAADKIKIDFKTKTVRFIKGHTELSPAYLGGNFVDDLYIKSLGGGGSKKEFECEYCESTTCRAEHPHYRLNAKMTNIIPNRRMVLKEVDVWLLNRWILHLPMLVIPLEKHPYRYFPECGYNPEEGYYIKTNIGFPIKNDLFVLKTDYFSKKGFGLGGEYHYQKDENKGKAEFYSLLSDKSIKGHIHHKQAVDKGVFETDIAFSRRDRYTSPFGWFYRTNTQYSTPFGNGGLNLRYIRNQQSSRWGKDLEEVTEVQLDQSLTKEVKTNIDVNYNKYQDPYQKQRFLDLKLKLDGTFKYLDTNFLYQRKIPIEVGPYYRGVTTDRTPFIECRTHTEKLFGPAQPNKGLAYFMPLEVKTSYGQFFDVKNTKTFSIYRSNISVGTRKSYEQGNTKIDWQGLYDQRIYSDQTAQYILNFNSEYRYKLGSDTEAKLRYHYVHPYGYTPLSIDRVNRTNRLLTDLGVRIHPQLLFTTHTGYDFLYQRDRNKKLLRSPWLPLRTGFTWIPTSTFKFEVNSVYDSNLKQWTGQTLLASWDTFGGQIAAGARYDSIRKKWSSLGLYAKSIQYGHTNFGTLIRYNGYTGKLTEAHVKVIYDLHCMEAAFHVGKRFTGRPRLEYGLYLYLKASPYQVPDPLGSYGEARTLLDYYD